MPESTESLAREAKSQGSNMAEGISVINALRHEHELTFREAVRRYPPAIGWSVLVSIGVIMLAFDPQILGGFFATRKFQEDFGYYFDAEHHYIISAAWQSGLNLGNPIGQVFGALFATYPMDYYGRKWTYGGCVALTGCLIFIQFFARSLTTLLIGELLGGLVLGCYVVIAPAYASEVCPMALRGHLTSYINLCFVMGQLLGTGVTAACHRLTTHWAYSIPFALQWFWVLLILPAVYFIPESPWWLIRQGRPAEAEAVLRRLSSKNCTEYDIVASLIAITETDRLERTLEAGSSFKDCFRGVNFRRTEIATGVYCTQVLSGIYMLGYITVFFNHGSLSTYAAFNMSLGFMGMGIIGTVISWFFILKWGRRAIFLTGLSVMSVLMFVIAIIDCIPRPDGSFGPGGPPPPGGHPPGGPPPGGPPPGGPPPGPPPGGPSGPPPPGGPGVSGDGIDWAESAVLMVWNFVYNLTIGPVCFIIIAECSATRVRSKTIAVCTSIQGLVGIVMTVAIPYLINPDQANAQGKIGFFFGGLTLMALVWAYFRVPETSGRTFEELDHLFDKRVDARDFGTYDLVADREMELNNMSLRSEELKEN